MTRPANGRRAGARAPLADDSPERPRAGAGAPAGQHPIDPERSRRGRGNRARGYAFERQTRDWLNRIGGEAVIVSRGCACPYDIVWMWPGRKTVLIDCKLPGYQTPLEREAIRAAAWRAGADAKMAWKPGRGRIELKEVKP